MSTINYEFMIWYAAKLARDLHERMRRLDASIKIQKYWRRYTTRKSYKILVSKTITIQTGLRALSAHLALVDKLRNRAATHIQVMLISSFSRHCIFFGLKEHPYQSILR